MREISRPATIAIIAITATMIIIMFRELAVMGGGVGVACTIRLPVPVLLDK